VFQFLKVEINNMLDLSKRAQGRAYKVVWALIGLKWVKDFLPRHFTTQATSKYGYKIRTPGTLKKKKQLAQMGKVESGGVVPLVWFGVLRRALTLYRQRQSVYPTRVTVHLRGPSYFSTNYKPNRPHYAREITTVSADEVHDMNQYAGHEMRDAALAEFKKAKLRKTITVR
jgi:hypothetical protein